jgi:hypothetical protein
MVAENPSGRPCRCQQASETTSKYRLETSSCTIVRSTMQHVKQEIHEGNRTYADADEYGNNTNQTNERRFYDQLQME